jgi:hypothetical protein
VIAPNNWKSHDFATKMLAWSAAQGSTLEYKCRRCGRRFRQFTAGRRGTWAVDGEGRALNGGVSNRWKLDECPRFSSSKDDQDRQQLSNLSTSERDDNSTT